VYIGQQPSTTFDSGIQDRFTGLTTNTVTLTHDISSEVDILVVWNNIVQDSSTYSVGGVGNKTLTLGGTLSSGDVVTVYYTNRVMQSVSPTAGSVQTLSINDGAVTNAKLANSSVSINGSSVSLGGSITGIGESNIPNFHANQASTSISNNVGVTVVYSNEVWDTASLYNTSTGKFTVTSATTGYYLIYAGVKFNVMSSNRVQLRILYNNGSSNITFALTEIQISSGYAAPHVAVVVPLLSNGHYVYTEAYQNSGGTIGLSNEVEGTYFGGFKLG